MGNYIFQKCLWCNRPTKSSIDKANQDITCKVHYSNSHQCNQQRRRKPPKAGWVSSTVCGWGHNLPPLVVIGLTDFPKPGWAIAHPPPKPQQCMQLLISDSGAHLFNAGTLWWRPWLSPPFWYWWPKISRHWMHGRICNYCSCHPWHLLDGSYSYFLGEYNLPKITAHLGIEMMHIQ